MRKKVYKTYVTTPTFGQTLSFLMKHQREDNNYTNESLAEAIKVSAEMISKYRSNRACPSIDTIIMLIRVFRLHPLSALAFAALAGHDITIPSRYNKMVFDKIYDFTYHQ